MLRARQIVSALLNERMPVTAKHAVGRDQTGAHLDVIQLGRAYGVNYTDNPGFIEAKYMGATSGGYRYRVIGQYLADEDDDEDQIDVGQSAFVGKYYVTDVYVARVGEDWAADFSGDAQDFDELDDAYAAFARP